MTQSKNAVLIIGAVSEIGQATARAFAARGHRILLAARRIERLSDIASDLRLRHGAVVTLHEFDALDFVSHAQFIDALPILPDVAICVVGILDDQAACNTDPLRAAAVLRANFEGPALILNALANRFERRGHGCLIGVSSVAGQRGRASNYVYGSAKAGFTAFLSGLRNRLSRCSVRVVTVLPGFVDTRMTVGMSLPTRLTAQPDEVGVAIFAAYRSNCNVIYVRPIWRWIMTLICMIPETIFKRLNL